MDKGKLAPYLVVVLVAACATAVASWFLHRPVQPTGGRPVATSVGAAESEAAPMDEISADVASTGNAVEATLDPIREETAHPNAPAPVAPIVVNAAAGTLDPENAARTRKAAWMVDKQYGAFLEHLASIGGNAEKFRTLLLERQLLISDIFEVGRANGVGDTNETAALRELAKSSVREFNAHMKQAVGDDAYGEFTRFQARLGEFNVAADLGQRLTGTPHELTPTQRSQVISALYETKDSTGWKKSYSEDDRDGGPGKSEKFQKPLSRRLRRSLRHPSLSSFMLFTRSRLNEGQRWAHRRSRVPFSPSSLSDFEIQGSLASHIREKKFIRRQIFIYRRLQSRKLDRLLGPAFDSAWFHTRLRF